MHCTGIAGVSRRRQFTTTVRAPDARPAPDLVDRHFTVDAPDRLWVADITYIPTATGFLYLAVVLDVWSRRIVGWAMASHLRTELVMDALDMALKQRRPGECDPSFRPGLPVHLDRLWPAVSRGGRTAVDGLGRRRL